MILPYNWKEYLRPTNIRDAMNRNQSVISIVAVVLTIIAIAYIIHYEFHSPYATSVNQYFYDTATQQLKVEPPTAIPPLRGAGGKYTLVRAYVFTCSSCNNKQIGFLQKYTPEGKAALLKQQQMAKQPPPKPGSRPGPNGDTQFNNPFSLQMQAYNNSLVRLPAKGSRWVLANSPEGERIMTPAPCATGVLKPCVPPS